MTVLFVALTISILFGLPALFVISACIAASRNTRIEESSSVRLGGHHRSPYGQSKSPLSVHRELRPEPDV